MAAGWAAASMGVSMVSSYFGGRAAKKQADKAAKAANEARAAQYGYDLERYFMDRSKLQQDHAYATEGVLIAQRNDQRVANFSDAERGARYNYDLQIRNAEQRSLNEQYIRSDQLYNEQLKFNYLSERAAMGGEYRKLTDIHTEDAFARNEAYLESLVAEGQARARGGFGRSAAKQAQALRAADARVDAQLTESMTSSRRNTRAILKDIIRDRQGADLAAYAQKMLDPGELPMPIIPYRTVRSEFQLPRELQRFDFGPQPIMGARAVSSISSGQVWAGVGSAAAAGLGAIAAAEGAKQSGTGGSDIALKENIEQVGVSPSGLNIYEWNYIGENSRYRGVIAQDLLLKGRQDAVTEMDNGYLGVYYDKIDVNMSQI